MSSAGQIVGGIVGGVAGAFVGNPMLGASIGMAIGGYIDPPPGQNTVGPRLEDLTVQTSTYGAVLPRIKGTVAVTGNVFWLEGDKIKEHEKTEKVGGKGGPTSKQTTFSYSATFAVGLSHQISAPIAGVRRLWLANTLVYDAGSGDINSIIASNQQAGVMFKFYDGNDDQLPDPRMQADKGTANVSGYPGRAYIVFYDLDLTEHYNNTLMATQVKVELVCGTAGSPAHTAIFTTPDVYSEREIVSAVLSQGSIEYAVARVRGWDGQFDGVDYYASKFGEYLKLTSSMDHLIQVTYGRTGCYIIFVCHAHDGILRVITSQGDFIHGNTRLTFISGGSVIESKWLSNAEFAYGYYTMAACDGVEAFFADSQSAIPIARFDGSIVSAKSTVSVRANYIALSETRVFIANYTGATNSTTITVLDRSDLSLIANYTQAVNGYRGVLHVVSDTEFYLVAGDYLSHWVDGVAENLGAVCHLPTGNYPYRWAAIYNDPDYFVQFDPSSGSGYELSGFITNFPISAQVAKLRDVVTEECALAGVSSADIDLTELIDSDVRGYRVSQAGSVRSVLEQLQAAFPFDVIQSGYKLKFKSRGGSSVLTVPESDLGAHTGNETPSRFMLTTEMPSQVPAKITFNFLNADREYDPDEQSAAFTAQDVKNSYTVSLPLVMTPTEALQAADVLLKKEQRERTSAGTFWLPPSDDYRKLEAADVIDVIAQGRTHTIRLTKVTQLPDGRIECDGKLTSSAAYASSAVAQSSLALGQSGVPLAGSSELVLLDIPRIVSDQDVPGISLAMYGYTAGWPGGVAFRSDDSGESYNAITGFQSKTKAFVVAGLPATVSPYSVDFSTALTVTPAWTGADLYSLSESQFYAFGNMAAYGAPGRWEIVCFKTAIDNGDGTYALRDFLRGRFGTEAHMGAHGAGDLLVMLDLDAVDFVGLPLSTINSLRLWRGVTSGASLESVGDVENYYGSVNLKPLPPVDLGGSKNPANDWTITAQRRTRLPVELFSGVAVPLGEAAAAYDIEIWSDDWSTIKRTFGSLPVLSANYTNSQQITDFGSVKTALNIKAYQLSSVVGRGFPLVATITRPSYLVFNYVNSLLHFNSIAGSSSFYDETDNVVTVTGGVISSATQSKFGGVSGYFPGGSAKLTLTPSSKFQFGTGDFTIESFFYVSAQVNDYCYIFHYLHSSGQHFYLRFGDYGYGYKLQFSMTDASSAVVYSAANTQASMAGGWHYAKLYRESGTVKLNVDGALVNFGTGVNPGTYPLSSINDSTSLNITTVEVGDGFFGWLDEFRSTNGLARTGLTVPTAEFPNTDDN